MGQSGSEASGAWLLVYTRPNSERKAQRWLEMVGWDVYCPLFLEQKIGRAGVSEVSRPLFPRYIFARETEDQLGLTSDPVSVRYSPGVSDLIRRADLSFARLDDEVIRAIRSTEEAGLVLPEPSTPTQYEQGDQVEVSLSYGGIGYQIVGTFLEMRSDKRAVVLLSLFGVENRSSVDLDQIERVLL